MQLKFGGGESQNILLSLLSLDDFSVQNNLHVSVVPFGVACLGSLCTQPVEHTIFHLITSSDPGTV